MNSKKIAFIVSILVVASLFYFLTRPFPSNQKVKETYTDRNPKAIILKNYLLQQPKPQRIEIFNYTKKFESEVALIKKLKIPQDKNSNIYMTIQFFTDEDDPKAPLIAQIRTLDIKTQNLLKEESINLE